MLPTTSVLRRLARGSRFGSSSSVMAPPFTVAPTSNVQAAPGPSPSQMMRPFSAAAAAENKKKKTKKGGGGKDDGDESTTKSSYFTRKAAAKEERRATYQHKISMNDKRRGRRDGTPHNLKPNFRQWFDSIKAHDERLERKARQSSSSTKSNNGWKIQVACIVERLPVVMPDKPSWFEDYEQLQDYEQQFGKQYPPEFVGHNNAETYLKALGDDMKPPTDDELMAMLPENFKPAPRETAADLDGSVDTLDRKLKDRVYLMFTNDDDDSEDGDATPYFPTTTLEDEENESLLEAAQRALQEHLASKGKKKKGGGDGELGLPLDLYCPSNMPIAVRLEENKNDDKSDEYFGTKTFFMKVQYDDGKLTSRDVSKGLKFCWLDRQEIVDKVAAAATTAAAPSSNDHDDDLATDSSKFYQYML